MLEVVLGRELGEHRVPDQDHSDHDASSNGISSEASEASEASETSVNEPGQSETSVNEQQRLRVIFWGRECCGFCHAYSNMA